MAGGEREKVREMRGHNSSLIVIGDGPSSQSDKHSNALLIKCHPISAHAKAFSLVHTHGHAHAYTHTHTYNYFSSLFTSLPCIIFLFLLYTNRPHTTDHTTTYSQLFKYPVKDVSGCTDRCHSTTLRQNLCCRRIPFLKCHFLLAKGRLSSIIKYDEYQHEHWFCHQLF